MKYYFKTGQKFWNTHFWIFVRYENFKKKQWFFIANLIEPVRSQILSSGGSMKGRRRLLITSILDTHFPHITCTVLKITNIIKIHEAPSERRQKKITNLLITIWILCCCCCCYFCYYFASHYYYFFIIFISLSVCLFVYFYDLTFILSHFKYCVHCQDIIMVLKKYTTMQILCFSHVYILWKIIIENLQQLNSTWFIIIIKLLQFI